MYTLIFLSLTLVLIAFWFAFMAHPLAMGLTLIAQTILICSATGLLSGLSWFSYILFLIFLGATLVLFIYVASLASNEVFSTTPLMTLTLIVPIGLIPLIVFSESLMLPSKEILENSFLIYPEEINATQIKLNNMYNPVSANLTKVVILYLFLTLIVVVNLSSSFFGPLRMS
uniref:NADH dehydrogenase subunit 6 n=1 Tax=Palaemon adspersus TaxID=1169710 RepID=UPI001620C552|nr:NADH dehydrogenase subunit 6 [Palaemon adspersus]QLM01577.1 NADH dehydrogenase subunit 6 [Palaemon adspersus]